MPESLAPFCAPLRTGALAPQDPLESVIVTAFVEIGREGWSDETGEASPHRRGRDLYLQRFGHLARLPNPMVVFVETALAGAALAARRDCGLEDKTRIVLIDRLFERPPLDGLIAEVGARMTPRYRRWVLHPEAPEYREPRYVLVNALKSAFVNAAVDLGLVAAAQIAWVDFGYCPDDKRFDPSRPWRFDAGERINLFHMAALDAQPIPRVARRGDVYFQGCHLVGPTAAWRPFAGEMADALDALLACDLVDDDQTMLLMAWRRDPGAYRLHAVPPPDWRVLFQRFNAQTPLEAPPLPFASTPREESALREELRIELKRWEWRFKAWRRRLGWK